MHMTRQDNEDADDDVTLRRARFRHALTVARLTQNEWARATARVSPAYLSRVVNGRARSTRVERLIDAFTNTTLAVVAQHETEQQRENGSTDDGSRTHRRMTLL